MIPIPRRFLIHSAEVFSVLSEDCFGVKTYSDGTVLRHVRVDYSEKEKTKERDMLNIEPGGSAVLFYDCRNSSPKGFVFAAGQEAVINGKRFRITGVTEFYDDRRLHHIEAALTEAGT